MSWDIHIPVHDNRIYKQVELVRGSTKLTTWVEVAFAVEGKPVRLQRDGEWEEGWTVGTVFDMERTGTQISDHKGALHDYGRKKGPKKRKNNFPSPPEWPS